ncbi:lysozyme inhibitor LprI family protein [Oceanicola sp. 502str15]|uniref:lysozyme inhibitor LprI family protein n=1 Tax=Oceanicola sp. 502str15 TaxID=2696061 RepID=UPI002095EFD5|nr:lysozyme inhibitor LprI family protein [Oceanicola sp. 502str15]
MRYLMRLAGLAAAVAMMLAAPPAMAQELSFDPLLIEECEEGRPELAERAQCIGTAANACMENTEGGGSTMGMNGCLEAEWQYWDGRLNAHYREAMARAKAFDADMATAENGLLSTADTLRDMQRAWIAFRDAKCDFIRAQWTGGTGQGPAMLSCLMDETGRQALWLQLHGNNL